MKFREGQKKLLAKTIEVSVEMEKSVEIHYSS